MGNKNKPPKHYLKFKRLYPGLFAAWEAIGKSVREDGPIDPKTGHLIQLASAAAVRSEGAVHSHVRRALEAGAAPGEIRQALLAVASSIVFSTRFADAVG